MHNLNEITWPAAFVLIVGFIALASVLISVFGEWPKWKN